MIKRTVENIIVVFSVIAIFLISCREDQIVNGDCTQSIDQNALFATLDGKHAGIWVFDINTLTRIDTAITAPSAPYMIEFSPDYSIWYSIWSEQLYQRTLFAIEAKSKKVIKRIETKNLYLSAVRCKEILITYLDSTLQFFDRQTLSLLHEVTITSASKIVSAPNQKLIYIFTYNGILIYNVERLESIRYLSSLDSLFGIVPFLVEFL